MPVSPKIRRERRAYNTPAKIFPKKRCANCPKFFSQTVPHKKFCSKICKREFETYGAAWAPLREKVAKEIAKQTREMRAALEAKLAELNFRLLNLETKSPDGHFTEIH